MKTMENIAIVNLLPNKNPRNKHLLFDFDVRVGELTINGFKLHKNVPHGLRVMYPQVGERTDDGRWLNRPSVLFPYSVKEVIWSLILREYDKANNDGIDTTPLDELKWQDTKDIDKLLEDLV
jgi:hypothetical protein